jgi:outer membrane lipoprotein-sorting protein
MKKNMQNLITENLKKLAFTIFVTVGLTATAQDKKAKDLLDEVTKKVKGYENISIDFKYTLNNTKENINQESSGSVVMKGNQYVLNFMGMTKLYDGKKLYTIVPEDEEISISKIDEKDANAITPSKMLTFFNKGYKFHWDIQQTVKGKKLQYVKLVPDDKKDKRKEILVGIDTQTKQIYNVIETGKNGTKTTLVVNSFKTNQALPKNQFTFVESKYPNYYINKLD